MTTTTTTTTRSTVDLAGLARPSWSDEERANAELVAEFVQLLMNEHDVQAVTARFGGGTYTQHNRNMADGIEGVVKAVGDLVRRFPEYGYDVKRILVDGDHVTFHSHVTMRAKHRGDDRKGFNIMDTWRIVDGEIVEHWDTLQPLHLAMRLYAAVVGGRINNANGVF